MSNSKVLRRCNDFVEAEAMRTRLDAAGILAIINGSEAHLAFSHMGPGGLGGVRLEVAPEDYDRAVRLLEHDEQKAAALGPWVCQRCNEQNEATFELCWSCQKSRSEDDYQGELDEEPEIEPTAELGPPTAEPPGQVIPDDRNPYRPVLLEEGVAAAPQTVEEADDVIGRAYVASIVGTVLLPPLFNLYSIYLLTTAVAREGAKQPHLRFRAAVSWTINCASITIWSTIWRAQWLG